MHESMSYPIRDLRDGDMVADQLLLTHTTHYYLFCLTCFCAVAYRE